jgi:L-asparaginase/Glu-tRNA(Gln) amidotransferase subunit D
MSKLSQRVEKLEDGSGNYYRGLSYEELVESFSKWMSDEQKQAAIDDPSENLSPEDWATITPHLMKALASDDFDGYLEQLQSDAPE